jgi:hypothetical protein
VLPSVQPSACVAPWWTVGQPFSRADGGGHREQNGPIVGLLSWLVTQRQSLPRRRKLCVRVTSHRCVQAAWSEAVLQRSGPGAGGTHSPPSLSVPHPREAGFVCTRTRVCACGCAVSTRVSCGCVCAGAHVVCICLCTHAPMCAVSCHLTARIPTEEVPC